MNKKIILSLIIILLIILAGGGYYFLIYKNSLPGSAPATSSSTPSLFPGDNSRPLGNNGSTASNSTATSSASSGNNSVNPLSSRFVRVSNGAVTAILTVGNAASSSVWYIEKDTGHLYRSNPSGEFELASNTTIPKISSLVGGKTAAPFIIRYTKDGRNQNYLARLATSSTEITGQFLPATAFAFAVSPDRNNFAYLDRVNSKITLVTSDWQYKKPTTIATTELGELSLDWLATSTILLTTKPSANTPGFTYSFDLKTKQLTRLIDNVPGLAILPSPNGKQILYSGTNNNKPFLALYDLKKQQVSRVALSTLVNKCVWTPDAITVYCGSPNEIPTATYPDNWLSGEVSLSDKLWQINTTSGSVQLVFNPSLQDSKLTLDTYHLAYNSALNRLYVINKTDLSLWALDLRLGF